MTVEIKQKQKKMCACNILWKMRAVSKNLWSFLKRQDKYRNERKIYFNSLDKMWHKNTEEVHINWVDISGEYFIEESIGTQVGKISNFFLRQTHSIESFGNVGESFRLSWPGPVE